MIPILIGAAIVGAIGLTLGLGFWLAFRAGELVEALVGRSGFWSGAAYGAVIFPWLGAMAGAIYVAAVHFLGAP